MTTLLAFALAAFQAHATYLPSNSVPQVDPFVTTLSVRALKNETKEKRYTLKSLPGRDSVAVFNHLPALDFAFFKAGTKAPLVFVVPGLGGTTSEGSALYLGDLINRAGYNVAVVANPFSWKFVLKRSAVAVPGYLPDEAKELAQMFGEVRERLAQDGIQPSSVSAVGYSLGAIQLGLLELAGKRGDLKAGLSRVVLINPPLDMSFALDALDKLEKFRDRFTPEQRDLMWGSVISKASALQMPRGAALDTFVTTAMAKLGCSRSQAAFLIGETFRQSLADIMIVSQQVDDRGLLKQPFSKYHRNARESEASNILYGEYMRNFMMPFWQRKLATNFDDAGFVAQASLARQAGELASIPAIRLVHNADDFLTRQDDLRAVEAALGARSAVFPYGGHVGNLWAPNVAKAIVGFLR